MQLTIKCQSMQVAHAEAQGLGGVMVWELRQVQEGRCKATGKREFKLPWHEVRPPNHRW